MKKEREMEDRVRTVLDQVRKNLQADGGDAQLVEVTADGIVKVRLQGACRGCPMSQMTLKRGIEAAIRKEIPEVQRVEAVD